MCENERVSLCVVTLKYELHQNVFKGNFTDKSQWQNQNVSVKQLSRISLPTFSVSVACFSVPLSMGAQIMFCNNHAVNYRQQVPPGRKVLDPLSHPAGTSQSPSLCEIMRWIVVQRKDHSMEMWAGTNRIGFDSLDSLSSSWLEFHSMSPQASHF